MTRALDPMRALSSLRDVDVPVGARSRVRAKLEAQIDRRAVTPGSSRRWVIGVALAAPIAIVAIVALSQRSDGRAISVAGGERYDVQLGSGHVSIRGPAEAAVSGDQLSLVQGTVDAQGQLRVKGPACDVVVQGSAEVSVTGAQLTVRVFAGSVEVVPPAFTCEVIDMTSRPITASADRKTPSPAIAATATADVVTPLPDVVTPPSAPEPRAASRSREVPAVKIAPTRTVSEAPAPSEAPTSNEAPTRTEAPARSDAPTREAPAPGAVALPPTPHPAQLPDPLADAVAAYHAAVALEASDLPAARKAWLAWRARWSKSPLAQSVDLHLLAVLDKLGRRGEASDLAHEFVLRYPSSPRRAEVERLIVDGP